MRTSPSKPAKAGRRPKAGGDARGPRSRPIALRLGVDDLAVLDDGAKARRLTRSEAMRRLIRRGFGLLQPDTALVLEWRETRRQLQALGNNLNQLARSSHRGGVVWTDDDRAEIDQARREIATVTARLNAALRARKRAGGGTVLDGPAESRS